MNKESALGLVRLLISLGHQKEDALSNSAVPPEFRDYIRSELEMEENITLEPPRFIVDHEGEDWLRGVDRTAWYYWPTLREHLLSHDWSDASVRSLDETTDRILRQLASPETTQFDIRGLVLGYIQSGKTANFTAVIAKATDCGYRLIIVLSGIDKGLRRQTQIRLEKELIGPPGIYRDSVRFPPLGRQWHAFTNREIDGDFWPGNADQGSLQGPQPVIMVVKKNGAVLRRLQRWLDAASDEVKRIIPVLVIDDESDLASINTRGTYQTEDEPLPPDYEPPNVINGLIRKLLSTFQKRVYIAYTATPYANILIPNDTYDPEAQNDLYPADFIVDLPKPAGYFGAEELFGRMEPEEGEPVGGLDVIRTVTDSDIQQLEERHTPKCLEDAILQFVLAGAARAQRGDADKAATMLIHVSMLIESHTHVETLIRQKFTEFRDAWRYQPKAIRERLNTRWDQEFRPVTEAINPGLNVGFDQIEPHVGSFFEAIQIKTINSFTGQVLDYEHEPGLKAIAIGGNRLSRGLTLEGLLVSFFIRRSLTYDSLMQMGRWFGFRRGYEDITRIWTTAELAGWFTDLAYVEHRLREDIQVYEDMHLTPSLIGMRIFQHPAMQITSPLKRRFSRTTMISQSYSGKIEQTFKFPLDRLDELSAQADINHTAVTGFLSKIGTPVWDKKGPVWSDVNEKQVLEFLGSLRQDTQASNNACSLPLICAYIEHQSRPEINELKRWTIAVRGLEEEGEGLGEADWGVAGGNIRQISRTRIDGTLSLGVITSPGDEAVGLSNEARARFAQIKQEKPDLGVSVAARRARLPGEGLILIYPVSRNSHPDSINSRRPLYDDLTDSRVRDLIAFAISFPTSDNPKPVQAYLEGRVAWRAVE